MCYCANENGKIKTDFPGFGQLNGMNVFACDTSTKDVFVLDASNKWQAYQNPPANILNRQALVLEENNVRWVTISDPRPLIKQRIKARG